MAKRIKRESMFRKILVRLMREKNLSIRDAALIAVVAPSTIAGWRSGRTPDNFAAVQKLAAHFKVGLAFMLTGVADVEIGNSPPSITTLYDEGETLYFDVARIQIQQLSFRKK